MVRFDRGAAFNTSTFTVNGLIVYVHASFRVIGFRFFLCFLFSISSAHAITLCVNDVATFKGALTYAEIGATNALSIHLVQGTYLMDANQDYVFAVPMTFEGGYTANCLSRVVNPANTVINVGLDHSFNYNQQLGSPEAQINVDGLTFTNANQTLTFSSGEYHNIGANDPGSVRISRSRFTQISGGIARALAFTATDNELRLDNVVIDHISTSDPCAVNLFTTGGATNLINHMTADLGAGNDFCFSNFNPNETRVSNSILWNSGAGTAKFIGTLENSITVFTNNVFKGTFITGATVIIDNQINADPFWINPGAGNYRLRTAPLSPAINAATILVPGGEPSTDIEGTARFIGSRPDIGAYESPLVDFTQLTVTNQLDSGVGSLRQAILDANTSPSIAKEIKFNIRTVGNVPICPAVIGLSTTLPTIDSTVLIDGYSQPNSSVNTSVDAFNANLCVMIKPGVGTLTSAFRVSSTASATASLALRGVGLGGFSQPIQLLGGASHRITGNQIGGIANGINLPGAGINGISIGLNAGGSLIVGGINAADRNVIGNATFAGVDVQAAVVSSTDKCQIVNNLIGLSIDGISPLPNSTGLSANGSGCSIVLNRIAGNISTNLLVTGNNNVVQKNQIGITAVNTGIIGNNVIGLQVQGVGNIIGASGQGGIFSANTIRFNNVVGAIVKSDFANSNSLNANLIYDNGASFNALDIDLSPTGAPIGIAIGALTANDLGDTDSGPNQMQNFPVGTTLVYTGLGTGVNQLDRPATITATLDSNSGTHRVDAYYSSSANTLGLQGRGHAEVYLGHRNVLNLGGGVVSFSMPVVIPTQLSSGVVSFTATDNLGNTSELGTGLSIVSVLLPDALFLDGFEN